LKTAGAEAVEAWLEQPLSTLGVKKEPLSESVVSPPVLPVSGGDLLATVGAVGGGDFFQTGGLPPTSPSNPAFPASVLPEGSVIRGRYEVEGVLGMGGMGIVYKVRDRLRQRSLALKMLHPQIAAQGPERLAQELAIQETLHHEGVVRTYDLDMDAALGQLFFTMDYIEGTSLEVVLERALQQQQVPLFSMETVRSWFSQLVETLSYAHSRKVIHRDLKPSNILFTRDGELKLLDFGIARQVGTVTSLHTGGVGTPLYMAPEQWQRNPVLTPAVDQYALAVLLYQWLTGAPALVGRMPGPWEWLASQGIEPLFAQELDDVVLKALDALPQRRFADVRQFGEAVLSLL
jgi:serine/threonine-protein kinase